MVLGFFPLDLPHVVVVTTLLDDEETVTKLADHSVSNYLH